MRVVLNNLTAIRQKTGIGHYVAELVGALRAQPHGDQFVTFPGPWVEAGTAAWGRLHQGLGRLRNRHAGGPPGQPREGRVRQWLNSRARGWAAWHFRTFWSGRAFDLYHEPNSIPLPCDRPTVATVHDLSALLHPEWHPPDRAAYYARHFEAGLARCAHLLAVSDFTRRQLIEHLGVAPDRVTRVYNGMRADLRRLPAPAVQPVRERLGLPGQYLLHVGTIEPRKNLLLLLQAYGDLPSPVRARCPLVLAGGWGWNVQAVFDHYDRVARHQGVRRLGYVADADLPALYNGARALVFPSHYEGFGLPPLEMLACGGAVIASTAAAVVETVGGQAELVAASDRVGWRDAMYRVIVDDDWHATLCCGAEEAARPFTWQRCADETRGVYRVVLGQPSAMRCAA